MNCIELTITAQAPLAIGRQKPGGSVSEAENYLPGSVIRGAIAGHVLRAANHRNTDLSTNGGEFQSLFLDQEAAVFQNAYPAIARISSHELAFVSEPIHVVPATALSSKDNPGFKVNGKAANKQTGGVFDTLIDNYCAEQCGHAYDPSCPSDQGRVEAFRGVYSRTDENLEHRYRSHSTTTRFLTRVGINRRRATAQDEMLYSIEALNESFLRNKKAKYPKWEYFAYRSHIWVNGAELAQSLKTYINQNSNTFRLGGGVSRGLGQVTIQAEIKEQKEQKEQTSDLPQRMEEFNAKLDDRWQLWSALRQDDQSLPERTFFTLDLQSEAILTDNWQRTMVVSPAQLCETGTLNDADDLQLHAAYTSYDYRTGWNVAWGLMKELELVANRGATFLFSVKKLNGWTDSQWMTALANLEILGIGDRTTEGFGQIRFCDEFHTIFRENAV